MHSQSKFIEAEHQPLKKAYPQVQMRKNFTQKKLTGCLLKNPFVLRVEPIQKYFQQADRAKYLTFIVEGSMPMGKISATLHGRLGVTASTSLFLTCGKELACKAKTIQEYAELYKEEDGILYVGYASQDPFGGHVDTYAL